MAAGSVSPTISDSSPGIHSEDNIVTAIESPSTPNGSKIASPRQARNTHPPPAIVSPKKPRLNEASSPSGGCTTLMTFTTTINDLPDDCLSEIFSTLHPKDLLSLIQSSTSLSHFLWSRHRAGHIWKHSFKLLSVPQNPHPPPPDLPLPVYARLVFTNTCQVCGCYTEWELRVRMCPECIKNELVLFEDDSAPDAFPGVSVKDVVRTRPSTYGAAYLKEDLTNVQRKLSGTTPEVRESFIADRKIMLAAGRLHARGVIKYDLIVQARRKEARAANIVVRTSRIRQRLFSLGYGDQLSMPTSELDSHKLVNKPEPLTEREWGRIRPVLEGFMTEVRKCQEVSHQEALAQQADIRIRGVQKRKYKGRKHD